MTVEVGKISPRNMFSRKKQVPTDGNHVVTLATDRKVNADKGRFFLVSNPDTGEVMLEQLDKCTCEAD